MVAQLTLDQLVGVRVPIPQFFPEVREKSYANYNYLYLVTFA